jgi:hypothetical protein
MKRLLICLLLAYTVPTTAIAEDKHEVVVVNRYKLAAMSGLMNSVLANYKSRLVDPRGKQCVLLSVEHEFSGQFLFFATRLGPDHIEIICFTPGADGGKEWSGRQVKYEGEVKKHFEKIHGLLGTLTRHPKEKEEDSRMVLGEARVEIRVGEGEDIAWAQPRAGFINGHPKFKADLLQCISIASAMAEMPIPNDIE